MLIELARTQEERQIMELVFANGEIQIPVLMPPDAPPDRLAAVRAAFAAAIERSRPDRGERPSSSWCRGW